MKSRRFGVVVCLVAGASLACGERSSPPEDAGETARSAELAAARSRDCAAELERRAGDDPSAVAEALAVEPIRLAPYGGPAPAPLRAEVADRLERARADAAAASARARCTDDPSSAADARRRAERSLRTSAELCRAAAAVLREPVARSR